MPITLVPGGNVANAAINGNDVTITLPTLQENDVVIVFGGHHTRGGSSVGPSTAGYASLTTVTDTNVTANVSWKRMGASPDASVTCYGSGDVGDVAAYAAICLRGVMTSGTPTDQTTTTAGETLSTNPDPPSIVTQTAGAWVLAGALSRVNDTSITAPTNYSNLATAAASDANPYTVGMATREIASPSTENPASYTDWGTGRWIAMTVAITPAVSLSVADTLALADALAMTMGKVLTESATITEAFALKTGKVLTDAASLADAVSAVLMRTVSVADTLAILDTLALKLGKVITESMTLTDTAQALLVRLPSIQTRYAPRPLITLTIGAATKRYSTETLIVP